MPLLSIIIPVYNKANYLEPCLRSVLTQSTRDIEIIIINDGSTDGSDLICERFARSDDRIVYLSQPNSGVSAARNVGLKMAQGEYIGFIDSDDVIDHDMYEMLTKNIEEYDADISVCRMRVVFPKKTQEPNQTGIIKCMNHIEALSACLRGELDRSANNKIYKATLAKKVKFEGSINEDILFITHLFLAAKRTVIEEKVKYTYMVRENSASMSKFNLKYVQTIDVSAQIVHLVSQQSPECTREAEIFDIIANISLLNLILLSDITSYQDLYTRVTSNLSKYSELINNSPDVRRKHKIAYKLFSFSPTIYRVLMTTYCRMTNSEVLVRA